MSNRISGEIRRKGHVADGRSFFFLAKLFVRFHEMFADGGSPWSGKIRSAFHVSPYDLVCHTAHNNSEILPFPLAPQMNPPQIVFVSGYILNGATLSPLVQF